MAKKTYDWESGAKLDEHTRRKHKVLREYLTEYLIIRCRHPQRDRFRLAIIDGFCGGGRYDDGSPGSPIIILEVLKEASERINIQRAAEKMKPLQIDVLLVLNDFEPNTVKLCREHIAPHLEMAKESKNLSVSHYFFQENFESSYPKIKQLIQSEGYHSNVFFNLDQYGYKHVSISTLLDIMGTHRAPEVLLTFAVASLMAYLPKKNQNDLLSRLDHLGLKVKTLENFEDGVVTNNAWLGSIENQIFEAFRGLGVYTSPFAINNPGGWRYWLIHFARSYRARQAYNDILHKNSSAQAHFGRSGLQMLSYDPKHEGTLYSFERADRKQAVEQLRNDIPRAVANFGNAIGVAEFLEAIYNETPAHSDDINTAMLDNRDMKVITPTGHERRKNIMMDDTLIINPQLDFFSVLLPDSMKKAASKTKKGD